LEIFAKIFFVKTIFRIFHIRVADVCPPLCPLKKHPKNPHRYQVHYTPNPDVFTIPFLIH